MVNPRSQDLYVVQNQFGLIKIGRSVAIDQRVANIQKTTRCKLLVVATFSKCGDLEETVHLGAGEFRLLGEWFCGSEKARTAINNALGHSIIQWPISYDASRATEWLRKLATVRELEACSKALYREITILRTADGPHWAYDVSVAAIMRNPLIDGSLPDAAFITAGSKGFITNCDGTKRPIPRFSTEIDEALLVWPSAVRPTTFDGDAIACCIAGLSAHRAVLAKQISSARCDMSAFS